MLCYANLSYLAFDMASLMMQSPPEKFTSNPEFISCPIDVLSTSAWIVISNIVVPRKGKVVEPQGLLVVVDLLMSSRITNLG